MYCFLRKHITKSTRKRVFAFLISIIIITPASIFASNTSEETIAVFKTAIEASNVIEHPLTGRGTAITKLYSHQSDLLSGKKIFDFVFKGDMSRSTRIGVEEGKRGQPEVVWIKSEKCSVTRNHSKNYASVSRSPEYQFYHQLGYDFNRDTFLLWYLTPVSEHIRRVLNGPANLSTKIDSNGILHLITDYKGQNHREHQVIYLDPAKDYRLIGGLKIRENFKDPNRSHTDFLEIQWGQYGSNWYIKNAQFSVYKGVHSPEEKDSIDPDKLLQNTSVTITGFHPNVEVDDSEFTLDGLGLPKNTLIIDRIAGLTYRYNAGDTIENKKTRNLNSDENKPSKTVSAKYILEKMLENRNKVQNFKCVNEALEFRSEGHRKYLYNRVMKGSGNSELAEKHLKRPYIITIQKLAFDKQGRARVEKTIGASDPNGKLIELDAKQIITWDGEKAGYYEERPGKIYAATIGGTEQFTETSKHYRQPWGTFGGNFCDNLADAIKENREVKVEKQKEGKYKIEILYPEETKRVGIVDPNQGYTLASEDYYVHGRNEAGYDARYREVKPGIWFPVEGVYFNGLRKNPYHKITMKNKDLKINDLNFYNNLFQMDFVEGTHVYDAVSGLRYVVGEKTNQPNSEN